jgi:hypothetical protein
MPVKMLARHAILNPTITAVSTMITGLDVVLFPAVAQCRPVPVG